MIYLGDGRLAGWTNSTGNQIQGFNNVGRYVGYYDKQTKITYTSTGKQTGIGDLTALGFLILQNYKK